MQITLIHKKACLWVVLFLAVELTVVCPLYQIIHHIDIIELHCDDHSEERDSTQEEETCIYCFNVNPVVNPEGNIFLLPDPEADFEDIYDALVTETCIQFYTARPPPEILS